MRNIHYYLGLIFWSVFFFTSFFYSSFVTAQDFVNPAIEGGFLNDIGEALKPLLISLISKYPITSLILLLMAAARSLLKPYFEYRIAKDPSYQKELIEFEESKGFKIFNFLLDYLLSIKSRALKKK